MPESTRADGTVEPVAIRDAVTRAVARIEGTVVSIQVAPLEGPCELVARIDDGTGILDSVFMGRRVIPGIEPGVHIGVHGTVVAADEAPRIFNPVYELL